MNLWRRFRPGKSYSTNGCRIYAVGDVHGCFNKLVELLQRIEADQGSRPPVETHVVMLGDYIDRGPQSRGVCELLSAIEPSPYFHCLRGNHEQVMLDVLQGDVIALRHWLRFGGDAAMRSWGVDDVLIDRALRVEDAEVELLEAFQSCVSEDMAGWMASLPLWYLHGDYLFVHAGIKPGRALEEQSEQDLLWIREPFLSSRARHPWCVVHGHSQSEEADIRGSRIGIDTGAYHSGVLTAIGIEEDDQWVIQTDSVSP